MNWVADELAATGGALIEDQLNRTETQHRAERVRKSTDLIHRLTDRAGELLFNQSTRLSAIKESAPDLLSSMWETWDQLNVALAEFIDGKRPWDGQTLIETETTFPNALMRESEFNEWEPLKCKTTITKSDPDVVTWKNPIFS